MQIKKPGLRPLVAIAIVLAVLFVLIAPTLSLAPSALRASRAAQILFLCLLLYVSIVTEEVSVAIFQHARCRDFRHSEYRHRLSFLQQCNIVDLNCTRLC